MHSNQFTEQKHKKYCYIVDKARDIIKVDKELPVIGHYHDGGSGRLR